MSNYFDDFYKSAHKNPDFLAVKTYHKVAKNIETIMARRGINNTELAKLMGCSKPYVTKILGGDVNLTIATLAKISVALDCNFEAVLTCNEDVKSELVAREVWHLFNEVRVELTKVKESWSLLLKNSAALSGSEEFSSPSSSEFNVLSISDHKSYAPNLSSIAA